MLERAGRQTDVTVTECTYIHNIECGLRKIFRLVTQKKKPTAASLESKTTVGVSEEFGGG